MRNASNADPVAVSGLEYTAHMRRRDEAGRVVDPYRLFAAALDKAIKAVTEFTKASRGGEPAEAFLGDATELGSYLADPVDAIITSPPYHGAVDYYRRHQLEHFWLGLTDSQDDRLQLLGQYIGRPKVPQAIASFLTECLRRRSLRTGSRASATCQPSEPMPSSITSSPCRRRSRGSDR